MKKTFIILLVVVLTAFARLRCLDLSRKRALGRCRFVPAETVAFASLPDLPRTASRWPKTTLAKIGAEPEMKAFLERPFQYLTSERGGTEAAGILWKLKPGRIFARSRFRDLERCDLSGRFPVLGRQERTRPRGRAAARRALPRGSDCGSLARTTTWRRDRLQRSTRALTLYNASQGQWGFLSNNLETIKGRALIGPPAGRRTAASPTALPIRQFLASCRRIPICFCSASPRRRLGSLAWRSGPHWGRNPFLSRSNNSEKSRRLARPQRSMGPTCGITFLSCAEIRQTSARSITAPMKFTSQETVAYFEFVSGFPPSS